MNSVPNDPQSPFITSGIRVGTPAVTTRGFDADDCTNLAAWMCDICDDFENQKVIDAVKIKVAKLCALHPVYEQNK
jgi:glycine hydroxymethyltransferase